MIVRDRHDDQLLRAVFTGDPLQLPANARRIAEHHSPSGAGHERVTTLLGKEVDRRLRSRHRDQLAAPQQCHRHADARGEEFGLVGAIGAQHRDADRLVGARATVGAAESGAVARRDRRPSRIDEICERVRQAELRSPARTLLRGAEEPRLGGVRETGKRRRETRERVLRRHAVLDVRKQLVELVAKVVRCGLAAISLQRQRGERIGPGSSSKRKIDAPREQPAQEAEALGDLQRAVVRQHHATAADAKAAGQSRDRPDQRLRARSREHRSAVVLGDPVAVVAERFGEARKVDGVRERVGAARSRGDRRLVQDAESKWRAHRASGVHAASSR